MHVRRDVRRGGETRRDAPGGSSLRDAPCNMAHTPAQYPSRIPLPQPFFSSLARCHPPALPRTRMIAEPPVAIVHDASFKASACFRCMSLVISSRFFSAHLEPPFRGRPRGWAAPGRAATGLPTYCHSGPPASGPDSCHWGCPVAVKPGPRRHLSGAALVGQALLYLRPSHACVRGTIRLAWATDRPGARARAGSDRLRAATPAARARPARRSGPARRCPVPGPLPSPARTDSAAAALLLFIHSVCI